MRICRNPLCTRRWEGLPHIFHIKQNEHMCLNYVEPFTPMRNKASVFNFTLRACVSSKRVCAPRMQYVITPRGVWLRPKKCTFYLFCAHRRRGRKERRPQTSPWRPRRTTREAAAGGASRFSGHLSLSVSQSAAGAKGTGQRDAHVNIMGSVLSGGTDKVSPASPEKVRHSN